MSNLFVTTITEHRITKYADFYRDFYYNLYAILRNNIHKSMLDEIYIFIVRACTHLQL